MIYCVEDEPGIRELELYALKSAGFDGLGFPSSESFWQAMAEEKPRLILLDIMLPGEDGLTILRRLRQDAATSRIPVIMTTAKGTEFDKVQGLDMGADDYLAKPFGMLEMLSRIKAVLRRSEGGMGADKGKILQLGDLHMDMEQHKVHIGPQELALTLKEYELLQLFMSKPGQVFNRDSLLSQVWGMEYIGESRTVDVHISTLRTKLGEYGSRIATVRGVGYRWEQQL